MLIRVDSPENVFVSTDAVITAVVVVGDELTHVVLNTQHGQHTIKIRFADEDAADHYLIKTFGLDGVDESDYDDEWKTIPARSKFLVDLNDSQLKELAVSMDLTTKRNAFRLEREDLFGLFEYIEDSFIQEALFIRCAGERARSMILNTLSNSQLRKLAVSMNLRSEHHALRLKREGLLNLFKYIEDSCIQEAWNNLVKINPRKGN